MGLMHDKRRHARQLCARMLCAAPCVVLLTLPGTVVAAAHVYCTGERAHGWALEKLFRLAMAGTGLRAVEHRAWPLRGEGGSLLTMHIAKAHTVLGVCCAL